MAEKKAKAVKPWLVLKAAGDGLYSMVYRGPDGKLAREKAEKALLAIEGSSGAQVIVCRAAVLAVLSPNDLKASLPRDAF
jgi:hypothetical protein